MRAHQFKTKPKNRKQYSSTIPLTNSTFASCQLKLSKTPVSTSLRGLKPQLSKVDVRLLGMSELRSFSSVAIQPFLGECSMNCVKSSLRDHVSGRSNPVKHVVHFLNCLDFVSKLDGYSGNTSNIKLS